jgi:hypothetical protein
MRRRQLVILVLGCSCLIAITCMGTSVESIIAFLHPTKSIQTAQAGPYRVTLQIVPNPPAITRPADLTFQIVHSATQQLITNASVVVESDMESMDMSTDRVNASQQNNGTYLAHMPFTMSGIWQVRVAIAIPSMPSASAAFEIAV